MNVVNVDISGGQVDFVIGSGCYVCLISAPSLAVVTVKPNDQFAREVPLKPSHSVKADRDFDRWFVNCNAVAGGMLQFLISDKEDPFVLDAPLSNTTASIDSFGYSAVSQLGDIVSPYLISDSIAFATASTTVVNVFNSVLDCDFFDITLTNGLVTTSGYISSIWAFLDGVPFCAAKSAFYGSTVESVSAHCRVHGVRGKTMTVQGF